MRSRCGDGRGSSGDWQEVTAGQMGVAASMEVESLGESGGEVENSTEGESGDVAEERDREVDAVTKVHKENDNNCSRSLFTHSASFWGDVH